MVKTWNADALFSYLEPYYRDLERRLGTNFCHSKPIYRPFRSIEELNEWMGKSAYKEYDSFVAQVSDKPLFDDHINDEHGGLLLKGCGYVDTTEFLDAFLKNLPDGVTLKTEEFDFSKLSIRNDSIQYNGILGDKIIFCDGQLLGKNPLFNWLPLKPVKGELLFIRVDEPIDVIYNRGVFVIPLGDGLCKVGSTYDHNNLNDIVTEEGKLELTNRLEELVKFQFEIVDQKAGVRPATLDRKPFIGMHPTEHNVGVFNGFGTKGVSLVPYFASQFVNSMTKRSNLDEDVNISRYFSLY